MQKFRIYFRNFKFSKDKFTMHILKLRNEFDIGLEFRIDPYSVTLFETLRSTRFWSKVGTLCVTAQVAIFN